MIVSLFNPEKQFQLERYEICMERQQPTRVTCFTNKSMTSKFEFSLGIGDEVATNHCPLVLNRTREINAQLFENQLTEPLRYLLDRPFKKQLIAADYLRFFLELALAFKFLSKADYYEREVKAVKRQMNLHLSVQKILNKFKDKDWDNLISYMNQPKIRKVFESYNRDNPFPLLINSIIKEPRFLSFLKYII